MSTQPFCTRYHHAVELVGRRWTGAIIRALLPGPARFGALRDTIPDMSDRMLAERLRELEGEGVVERRVIPETPVRVEYALTEKGRGLEETVLALAKWAEKWVEVATPREADEERSRLSALGSRLEPRDVPPGEASNDSVAEGREPRAERKRSRTGSRS